MILSPQSANRGGKSYFLSCFQAPTKEVAVNTLFDIRTTVSATWAAVRPDGKLLFVNITASKAIRTRIWEIVTDDHFNPSAAHFKGGAPTVITLTPYSGYEDTDLVVQMAYAAACLALVTDFTTLLDRSVFDLLGDDVIPDRNFAADPEKIAAFQTRYVASMAAKTLQRLVDDGDGLSFYVAKATNLNDEAQEALRRLKFSEVTTAKLKDVEDLAREIAYIEKKVRNIYGQEIVSRRFLANEVNGFAAEIKAAGPTPVLVALYEILYTKLVAQAADLRRDADAFTGSWNELRGLMTEIRQNTPPPPPTAKK